MYLHFYVYAYLRKDGTPYYIGKGSGNRAWCKHRVKINGKWSGIQLPVDRSRIVILEKFLSELGSFAIERRMIRWYGRKDLNTGILYNRTNGGDGTSGAIKTETARKAISNRLKGRVSPTKGIVAWNKGISMTAEAKQKSSEKLKGRLPWNKGISASDESNQKRKEKQTGVLKPVITCPHCGKNGGKPAMIRHHFNNCKLL